MAFDIEMVGLAACSFLSTMCYSIIIPFLPPQLEDAGVDLTIIGALFSIYALVSAIGSMIIGKVMMRVGRRFILLLGIFCMGSSMLGSALIFRLGSLTSIIIFAFICRAVQGFSSCCIQTTNYAIVSVLFPDKRSNYVAAIEFVMGLGLLAGPMLGTFLYNTVGYELTFIIVSLIFYALIPLVYMILPITVNKKDNPEVIYEAQNSDEGVELQLSYYTLANNVHFMLPAIGGFLAYFILCFQGPVLSLELEKYRLSPFWYGFAFGIGPVFYMMSSVFVSYALKRLPNKTVIIVGSFLSCIGVFFMGPSNLLPNSVVLLIFGRVFVSLVIAALIIPPLLEMTDVSVPRFLGHKVKVTDMCSGFFNSSLCLGQMISPAFSSLVFKYYNYSTCGDICCIILVIYSTCYLALYCNTKDKDIICNTTYIIDKDDILSSFELESNE